MLKLFAPVFCALLALVTTQVAQADIIVLSGSQQFSVDGSLPSTTTIDYINAATGTLNSGTGVVGSIITVNYGSSGASAQRSFTWQVSSSRPNSPLSSTISQSSVIVSSNSAMNFALAVDWNGLTVPSGLAALNISIKNAVTGDTLYPEISASSFGGRIEGGFLPLYSGSLPSSQQIEISINSVLFAGAESPGSASSLGNFSLTLVAVPEPSTLVLLAVSFGGLIFGRHRSSVRVRSA